jgi:3-phenylpropionate/cinnamic acid dioxygenase small subunit
VGSDHRPVVAEQFFDVMQFLYLEAALLDTQRYDEWLALLHEDIRYRMPVTVTTVVGQLSLTQSGLCHFDENHHSLSKRVERLLGEHAWTENPPSRTRRFVSNICVAPGESDDQLLCASYLLLFRSRLDVRPPEWVSALRNDVLARVQGAWQLQKRDIEIDESVLRTQNLAVFL